jgi:hypothetical protein
MDAAVLERRISVQYSGFWQKREGGCRAFCVGDWASKNSHVSYALCPIFTALIRV